MKKFFILFFIFFTSYLSAQTFNKRFVKDAWATKFKSCLIINDTLFVSGIYGLKNAAQNQKHSICQFNLEGNLISQHYFMGDSSRDYSELRSLFLSKSNKLIGVGYAGENGAQKYGTICIINKNLSNDTLIKYTDLNRFSFPFVDIVETGIDEFIIAGFSSKSGIGAATINKIKTSGELIWSKYLNLNSYIFPTSLTLKSNGRLILQSGSEVYFPNETNPSKVSTWNVIHEIDTATGNTLKFKKSVNDSISGSVALIPTPYNSFIIGGFKIDSVKEFDGNYLKGYLAKLDSNYNSVWEKRVASSSGNSYFNNIKKLADGNYLAVGECMNFDFDTTIPYSNPLKGMYAGWMVKFTEQGDILWDRKHYGVASYLEFNRLFDFVELPNGDIIAVGESTNMYNDDNFTQDSITQMGWLLRVNANGCLSPTDCGYTSIANSAEKKLNIAIYPNPIANQLYIETQALVPNQSYTLLLSDIHGKAVSRSIPLLANSSITVDVSDYIAGTYIVTVYSEEKPILSKRIIKQ